MRSIRSCSRARTTERGGAVVAALALSILYFGLISLLLVDSARELAAARRFRARVVAANLAENAAELAAQNIVNRAGNRVSLDSEAGEMKGDLRKSADGTFQIFGEAAATGVVPQSAWVKVFGRVEGNLIRIDYTIHSQ